MRPCFVSKICKGEVGSWQSVVAVMVLVLGLVAPAPGGFAQGNNGNPGVLPPPSHPYGMTSAAWAAAWTQWYYSLPFAQNPANDPTGADCGHGQGGPVWFLAGTLGGDPVTRMCTVPVGTAIFFPMIVYINDYPCPDPAFQPAPGQSLEDFLTEGAQVVIDDVTSLKVKVDGATLHHLFDYRATSRPFTFTGDPSLTATLDACVTGSPQPGVSDGYWIMLAPLSRGTHRIHFQAATGSGFGLHVTYDLTVAPRKP